MKTVTIPIDLARLLMADDDDFKNPETAADARSLARASLRLLVVADEAAHEDRLATRRKKRAKATKGTKPAAPKAGSHDDGSTQG